MKIPITRNLPPDHPVAETMYECTLCGGYELDCCEGRDAHQVVYQSQWAGIETFEEWCLLELCRLRDKGVNAWVQEGVGRFEGTIAIYRDMGDDVSDAVDTPGNADEREREVGE